MLLIVGCTSQQPATAPVPTETQGEIISTNTSPPPNTPMPTRQIPTLTKTPEGIAAPGLDFSSLEGIQIYYSYNSGIGSIMLPCISESARCGDPREVAAFSQMTSFTQVDRISLFPGEGQFVFSAGDYSRNGSADLFSYDLETGLSERLTDTSDYNDIGWPSPDGGSLVVAADRNGGGHSYLHIIGRDGCCLTTIPNQLTYDRSPAWSPDGAQIAFFSENRNQAEILIYSLSSKVVKELMNNSSMKKSGTAIWSPDGQKLAFVATFDRGVDLCIVELAANHTNCLAENKQIEHIPSWSLDSTELIYSAFDIESGSEDIYRVKADLTELTKITSTGSYQNPVWLNDSFFICETSSQGAAQLNLVSFNGTWMQPLTAQPGGVSLLKIVFP